jgi:hypothetical protein
MGTSKSTKQSDELIGGASIFSGRRDPTWTINQGIAGRLKALWDSMEPYTAGAPPSAPVLGYRGSFMRDEAGHEWFAYGGVVTLKGPEGAEARRDEKRAFEALLLSSAPEGEIPPQLLDPELRQK